MWVDANNFSPVRLMKPLYWAKMIVTAHEKSLLHTRNCDLYAVLKRWIGLAQCVQYATISTVACPLNVWLNDEAHCLPHLKLQKGKSKDVRKDKWPWPWSCHCEEIVFAICYVTLMIRSLLWVYEYKRWIKTRKQTEKLYFERPCHLCDNILSS